jgi:hypothetical protein
MTRTSTHSSVERPAAAIAATAMRPSVIVGWTNDTREGGIED